MIDIATREKIEQAYKQGMKYEELENTYYVSSRTIRDWKRKYKWERISSGKKEDKPKGKVGAPKGNKNNFKHGMYSKIESDSTDELINYIHSSGETPKSILWRSIVMYYARILKSQKIMHVKDEKDHTREIVKEVVRDKKGFIYKEKVYRTQYAWDKQARFMLVEGKALMILAKMIKEYETITRTETLISFEERRIRLSELKHEMVTSVKDVTELDEVEPLSSDLSAYNIDKSRLTSIRLRKRINKSNLYRRERPISFIMLKRDIAMR